MSYNHLYKEVAPKQGFPDYTTDIFGTLQANSFIKVVEQAFHAGIINDQSFNEFTASGGTIAADTTFGNTCLLSKSSSIGSFAVLRSRRAIIYRSGSVCVARGCVKFPPEEDIGVNSFHFVGAGNAQCDLYFCYSGGEFGCRRGTGGLLEVRTLTLSEAATTTETATIVLDGTTYTATLSNASGDIAFTAHEIEVGDDYSDSWNLEHIGNTIVFIAKSVGARDGTYSFSSTGTATGSFTRSKAGQAITEDFTPISECNGQSIMKDNINPQAFNMYEIEWVFYGVGGVKYKIYNPSTNRYETVHTLSFANKSTELFLSSQNMFFSAGVSSLGDTNEATLTLSGMVAGYIDGGGGALSPGLNPFYNIDRTVSLTGGTERVLMSLQNRFETNNFSNVSELFITRLSVTTDGAKPVKFEIFKNPTTLSANTTSDYTNFQYVDETGSPLVYDFTSLTRTGGTQIYSFFVGINATFNLRLDPTILISREDTISIVARSSNNNSVSISVDVSQDTG